MLTPTPSLILLSFALLHGNPASAQEASTPLPAATLTEDAKHSAPMCAANAEKHTAVNRFHQGAEDIRKEGDAISEGAQATAALVVKLANDAPKCSSWGHKIYEAIATPDDVLKLNLVQRIREVGRRAQDTAKKMANGVDSSKDRYRELDFCDVGACTSAFQSLSTIFTPLATVSKGSLGTLADLKKRFIQPATKILSENEANIRWVLSGPECRAQLKVYSDARKKWDEVEKQIAALEQKITRENQTAGAVAQGAIKGSVSCTAANR